jgi:hypothetical protein
LVDQVGKATERLRRDGRVLVLLLGPEAEVPKWLHEMAKVASRFPGELFGGRLRLRGMLCGDHLLGVRRGWRGRRGVA